MRRTMRAVGVVTALTVTLGLGGCSSSSSVDDAGVPDVPIACRLPSDCPEGTYCGAARSCTFDCRQDRDCLALGTGTTCDRTDGRCVRGGSDAGTDVVSTDVVSTDAVGTDVVSSDLGAPDVGTEDVPPSPSDAGTGEPDGYVSDEDPPGVGGGSCDEDGATIPGMALAPGACGNVSQGVCGGFSHAGKYAIDIIVNAGTSLVAPVAGRVVGARSIVPDSCSYSSQAGRNALRTAGRCPSDQGTDYGNYIAIAPTDGSLPSVVVAHMRSGSALVRVDDMVRAGQALGLSGSTGLSTAPHVHFACVRRGSEFGAFPSAPCNYTWRARSASVNSTGRPGAGTTVCGFDASAASCVAGASCAVAGEPCRTGTISCSTGAPLCVASGNSPAGTPCGSGQVCNGVGACGACVEGGSCSPAGQPCRTGTTGCSTGSPVCNATGNAPAGTSCGSGQICNGIGTCGVCIEGGSCSPTGQPCRTGTTSCSTGSPVCNASGNTSAGTACGSGQVCNGSGSCTSCSEGSSCSPPGQACRTGTISCASGSPVCTASGNAPAGTSCGSGQVCNGIGTCGACVEGGSCNPAGLACRMGTTSCSTGTPVCNATGNSPAGTSCGSGQICNGSGSCISCNEGSVCSPVGQPCRTGTIGCSTGSPVCNATGNTSAGTSCGSGQICNGIGTCVSCNEGGSCSPSGQTCRTGTISCASGSAVCNATGSAPMGTPCGSGLTCDGSGTCASSCRPEVADYADNDCDGVVDNGVRIPLARAYYSSGGGCSAAGANWDHCFATSGSTTCVGSGQGGGGSYVVDSAPPIYIYPLSVGGGGATAMVGPYTLARLDGCYNAGILDHRYAIPGSPAYPSGGGWSCVGIGYVKTGSGISDGVNTLVYEHTIGSVTDHFYSTVSTDGTGLPCTVTHASAWFGWTR